MSKKFTGVHSGGQNIPVYDKDAHSAIEQKLNTSAFQSVSGNFLTAVPDAYATKEYADGAAAAAASGKLDTDTFAQVSGDFLTAVPQSYLQNTDLTVTSGKVTEISGIPLSAGGTLPDTIPVSGVSGISVTETENQVLIGISADFATSSDLESKLDTSAFSSVSGDFLTAVPDDFATKEYLLSQISGKYDTSSFAEVSGNFLTAVPESAISGKQDTLEFGYDGNSAISGINGSALAGGIDPSMLTGYAEYSAISAKLAPEDIAIFTYNDSACPYAAIKSAYDAGKLCFAKFVYSNDYYPLVRIWEHPFSSDIKQAIFGKWRGFLGNNQNGYNPWSGTSTEANFALIICDNRWSADNGWNYGWTQNYFDPQKAGDYYSASNPSGFLTAVPSGVMQTSGLEYDGDKISGYMGSAFKAGDELPQSVTDAADYVSATSGDIDATIENVSSNSGAWGGSALPISAGPGIKFDMVNGTLVASTDETLLFSSDNKNGASAFSTSETIKNFERIAVLPARYENDELTGTGPYMYYNTENLSGGGATMNSICPMIFEYAFWKITRFSADDSLTNFNAVTGYQVDMTTHTYYSNQPCYVGIKQVIGINRIAGN